MAPAAFGLRGKPPRGFPLRRPRILLGRVNRFRLHGCGAIHGPRSLWGSAANRVVQCVSNAHSLGLRLGLGWMQGHPTASSTPPPHRSPRREPSGKRSNTHATSSHSPPPLGRQSYRLTTTASGTALRSRPPRRPLCQQRTFPRLAPRAWVDAGSPDGQ